MLDATFVLLIGITAGDVCFGSRCVTREIATSIVSVNSGTHHHGMQWDPVQLRGLIVCDLETLINPGVDPEFG